MATMLTVATRYSSAAVQFVISIIVARLLPASGLGSYLAAYGAVTATCFIAGIGTADGVVKSYPALVASGRNSHAGQLMRSYLRFGTCTAALMAAVWWAAAMVAGLSWAMALVTTIWWLGYATMNIGSQALVALGTANLGTFFYYGSTNWATLIATIVYAVCIPTHTLLGVAGAAGIGSFVSGIGCLWIARVKSPNALASPDPVPTRLITSGIPLTLGRVTQSALIWSPVWCAKIVFGAEVAAGVGLASRLVMTVGAAAAALRFAIRPKLVALAANAAWHEIELAGRKMALLCTGMCVAALAANLILGWAVLPMVFGSQFGDLWFVVAILLVGVCVESMSGPVDELLKMTDGANRVLMAQVVALLVGGAAQLIAGELVGEWLLLWVAATSFAGIYVYFVLCVVRQWGICPTLGGRLLLRFAPIVCRDRFGG